MRKMGVGSFLDPVPPLCVGAANISLYEMVAAYNTFPSKGEDLTVECALLTADPPDTRTQKSESENGNPPSRRSLKASWRPSSQQTKQERPAQASRATTRNKV